MGELEWLKSLHFFLPKKAKETQILDGSTDEIVSQLTDILKNKIKVG